MKKVLNEEEIWSDIWGKGKQFRAGIAGKERIGKMAADSDRIEI